MSRPRKKCDPALIETLAGYGLTIPEIASVVGCGESTLEKRFHAALEKGWGELKTSLKREQVAKALSGNVVMLIWLGKQYLQQSDRQQVDLTGEMSARMTMTATAPPAPVLTFGQALAMIEIMQLEMDPAKIQASEAAELDGVPPQTEPNKIKE